jgi:hypothetical protein
LEWAKRGDVGDRRYELTKRVTAAMRGREEGVHRFVCYATANKGSVPAIVMPFSLFACFKFYYLF